MKLFWRNYDACGYGGQHLLEQNTIVINDNLFAIIGVRNATLVEHEQLSSNDNEVVNAANFADFENLMPECEVVLMKSELVESLLTEAEKTCATTKNEDRTKIRAKRRVGRPRKIINHGNDQTEWNKQNCTLKIGVFFSVLDVNDAEQSDPFALNEFKSHDTTDLDLTDTDSESHESATIRTRRQKRKDSDSEYEPDVKSSEADSVSESETDESNDGCLMKKGRPKKRKIDGKEIITKFWGYEIISIDS